MVLNDETQGDDPHFVKKFDAIFRIELHIEPKKLSDKKWTELVSQYSFVQGLKQKRLQESVKIALSEVLAQGFATHE